MGMKWITFAALALVGGCVGRSLDVPDHASLVSRCQGCHEMAPASAQLPMTGNDDSDLQVVMANRDRVRRYISGGHGAVPADELQEWFELLDQAN